MDYKLIIVEINYIIFLFFWLFRSMDILTSYIQFEECLWVLFKYYFIWYRLCVCTNVGFVTILSNACLLCISVVNWKMHCHRTIKIQKCSSGSQFIHWNLLSLFKCLSHKKSCNIQKNVTKLISVRKKGYTFSKYLMPSILKYIIHISYIFPFSF